MDSVSINLGFEGIVTVDQLFLEPALHQMELEGTRGTISGELLYHLSSGIKRLHLIHNSNYICPDRQISFYVDHPLLGAAQMIPTVDST